MKQILRLTMPPLKEVFATLGLAVLSLGFGCASHPDTRYKPANRLAIVSAFHEDEKNERKEKTPIKLLADANVAMGVAGVQGGDYAASVTREIQFDAASIGNWFLHFGIREESLFDPSPAQLNHELEYLGIGYKTPKGRVKFFWDHTCYNPSRKLPETKTNGIHWNEFGIGYETIGMMLGHKNDGIQFDSSSEWLNKINWKSSLSRIWMRTENDYEWMLKLGIRDDVFRIGNHVFFIQADLDSIYDNRGINLNTHLELGDRIRLNQNTYLTSFVSYEHFQDWYSLGEGEDFFSAGLGIEMGLSSERDNKSSSSRKPKISFAPRFHINGGYTIILDNEEYGHSSDVGIDLDVLRLDQDKTLRLDTYVGILTLPHDLNPYVVLYEVGPSVKIEGDHFDLRAFHSYASLYSLEDENVVRDYNLLGLEARNTDVSHWTWDGRIGVYASTRNFDFWGDLQGSLGYDLLEKGITPYINWSGHYLQDNDSVFGHAIEAGVRIPGQIGSLCLYFRHQDDFDVFRFGRGRQTLLGFRIKI